MCIRDRLYTDEDKVTFDSKTYFHPHYKPDFSLDLLRSNNYICHFLVVGKKLLEKAGRYRESFDGAQDYDFILRCSELAGAVSDTHLDVYKRQSGACILMITMIGV